MLADEFRNILHIIIQSMKIITTSCGMPEIET